jgi:murein DD-endopeptidase
MKKTVILNTLMLSVLLAIGIAVLLVVTPQREAQAQESFFPVTVDVPTAPTPVKADGQVELLYELHVTNFSPATLELTRVEVFGDDGATLLASYEGTELASRLYHPNSAEMPDAPLIGSGLSAVVFLQLILETEGAVPSALHHRLVFRNESQEKIIVGGGAVSVEQRAPLVISPPLRGEGWLALNGLGNTSDHRRALIIANGKVSIAQRFATDWLLIGEGGQVFNTDPSENANWYGYGAEVLAVADAVVVAVQDGIPENAPLNGKRAVPITYETLGGNYVSLELSDGYFAFYAHLQPGSIRVKVGDQLERGGVVGLLGNSGNSDAPHLHFHITDGNSPFGSEGVPYVFELFEVQGKVESRAVFENGEGWRQPQTLQADKRERELPVENAVVRFP